MKPKNKKRIYGILTLVFMVICVHYLSVEPQTPECDIKAILSLAISMIFTIKFITEANK